MGPMRAAYAGVGRGTSTGQAYASCWDTRQFWEDQPMDALRLLFASYRRSVQLLNDPAVERQWAEQSALPHWSVAGLAGHLARSAFNLQRAAEAVPAPDARLMSVVDYYTCNEPQPADSTVGQRIRHLGDEEAAAGPRVLASRFAESVSSLERRSARDDLPQAVTLFGPPMSLDECAAACLLELVVHADDLAVSTGASMPEFEPDALELVASALTRISARRSGALPVVRTFARPERSSGRIAVF